MYFFVVVVPVILKLYFSKYQTTCPHVTLAFMVKH